jgi:hypothetical protein
MAMLTSQERKVVMSLRIAGSPDEPFPAGDKQFYAALPDALRAAFVALAREARAERLIAFAPGSAFVSGDELAIVGRLILLQRPSVSRNWQPVSSFQHALKECADELCRHGRRLPVRTALAEANLDRGSRFHFAQVNPLPVHEADDGEAASPAPRAGSDSLRPRGMLKARAIAMVRAQGRVPLAQLTAAGISRRYARLLCKRGFLQKIDENFFVLRTAITA